MEATLDNMLYTKGFYMTDFILASQKREVFLILPLLLCWGKWGKDVLEELSWVLAAAEAYPC